MLDRHDCSLLQTWTNGRRPSTLAEDRLPALRRLETLARHAEWHGCGGGCEAPQIEAIVGAGRRLLDASDPVPGLESDADGRAAERAFVEVGVTSSRKPTKTERQRLERRR